MHAQTLAHTPSRWAARVALALTAIVTLAPLASAQPDAAATGRLEEARKAIKEIATLSYRGEVAGEGPLYGTIESLESTVWLRREGEPPTNQWSHRRQGSVSVRDPRTGDRQELRFDVARVGPNVTYIDHENRTVYERFHRSARHSTITVANAGWIGEFVEPDPFDRALGGEDVELELLVGADKVGEELCDVVEVRFGDGRQVSRWSIAQSDDLPRRFERRFGEDNRQVFTITTMVRGETLGDEVFEIERPQGYAKNTTVRRRASDPDSQPTTTRSYPPARPFEVTIAAGPGKGEQVSLESLAGRVIVLDFWASWSNASKESRPDVQALHEKFQDQPVAVLSLSWRDRGREQAALQAHADSDATYPLATGADEAAMVYEVASFPTFFVIDRQGRLVASIDEYNPDGFLETISQAVQGALDGEFTQQTTTAGNGTVQTQQGSNNDTNDNNNDGGNRPGGNGNQSGGGNQPGGGKGGN